MNEYSDSICDLAIYGESIDKTEDNKFQQIPEAILQVKQNLSTTIDKIIDRGEKLEVLKKKSNNLDPVPRIFNRSLQEKKRKTLYQGINYRLIGLMLLDIMLFTGGVIFLLESEKIEIIIGLCAIGISVMMPLIAIFIKKYASLLNKKFDQLKKRWRTLIQTHIEVEWFDKNNDNCIMQQKNIDSETHLVTRFILPITIFDNLLIDSFLRLYRQLTSVNINQWPLSMIEPILDAFDLSAMLKQYHDLYEKFVAQNLLNKLTLTDEQRINLKNFLLKGQKFLQVNNFLLQDYPNLLLRLDSFKPNINEFLKIFQQLLAIQIGKNRALSAINDIDLSSIFELMIKKMLLSHIDRIQRLDTNERLLFAYDFPSKWSMIIKHVFRETKTNVEWLLKRQLTIHPIFGLAEDEKKIHVFEKLYQLFSNTHQTFCKNFRKEKWAIQSLAFQIQQSNSPDQTEKGVRRLLRAIQDYKLVLDKQKKQISSFIQWLISNRSIFEILKNNIPHDNLDMEDIHLAIHIKTVVEQAVRTHLNIEHVSESSDQLMSDIDTINPIGWLDKYLNIFIDQIKKISKNHKKNQRTVVVNQKNRYDLNDPLVCVSRYAYHYQNSRRMFLNFKNHLNAIKAEELKISWKDACCNLHKRLTHLIHQPYAGKTSVTAHKVYRKLINKNKQKLSEAVKNQIKSIYKPIFKIKKSNKILIDNKIVQVSIDCLKQKVKAITILPQSTKETIINIIYDIFLPIKIITKVENIKQLQHIFFSSNLEKSIKHLNMLVDDNISKKLHFWVNLDNEINFLRWMDRFYKIIKKINMINPNITGDYKKILEKITRRRWSQKISQNLSRLRNNEYSMLKAIIYPQINKLIYDLSDFDNIDNLMLDKFLNYVSSCNQEKNAIQELIKEQPDIFQSAIEKYMNKRIFKPINDLIQSIYNGKITVFSSQFLQMQASKPRYFSVIRDYMREISLYQIAMNEMQEIVKIMNTDFYYTLDAFMKNSKSTKNILLHQLNSIKQHQITLINNEFKGSVTLTLVKKNRQTVERLNQIFSKSVQRKTRSCYEQVSQYKNYLTKNSVKKNRFHIYDCERILPPFIITFLLDYYDQVVRFFQNWLDDYEKTIHLADQTQKFMTMTHIKKINQLLENKDINYFSKFIDMISFFEWVNEFKKLSVLLDQISVQEKNVKKIVADFQEYAKELYEIKNIDILIDLKNKFLYKFKKKIKQDYLIGEPLLYLNLQDLTLVKNNVKKLFEFYSKIKFWSHHVLINDKLLMEWRELVVKDVFALNGKMPNTLIKTIQKSLDKKIEYFQDGDFKSFCDSKNNPIHQYGQHLFTEELDNLFSHFQKIKKRKKIIANEIKKMMRLCNNDEVRSKLIWFHDSLSNHGIPEQAFEAFRHNYPIEADFFIFVATHIVCADRFKPFWNESLRMDYLKSDRGRLFIHRIASCQPSTLFFPIFFNLSKTEQNAIAILNFKKKLFIKKQSNMPLKNLLSFFKFDSEKINQERTIKINKQIIHNISYYVAKTQSAKVFSSFWASLTLKNRQTICLLKNIDLNNGLTMANLVLQYQPPEVFLSFWKNLNHITQKHLIFDSNFFSKRERWSIFQVASLMLPKSSFEQWIHELQKSFRLQSEEWRHWFLNMKDKSGCCILDTVACYRSDLLLTLFDQANMRINAWDESYAAWITQSPVIESVNMTVTGIDSYDMQIQYKNSKKKDAYGKSKLYWDAFQGNISSLEIGLSHFPSVKEMEGDDKLNQYYNIAVLAGWKIIEAMHTMISMDQFSHSLDYIQGGLLKMAVLGGQLEAVRLIADRIPQRVSQAFSLSILTINRFGIDRVKPIMNALLKIGDPKKWMTQSHHHALARLKYRVDFNTKSNNPTIKSSDYLLSTSDLRPKQIRHSINIHNNYYSLVRQISDPMTKQPLKEKSQLLKL